MVLSNNSSDEALPGLSIRKEGGRGWEIIYGQATYFLRRETCIPIQSIEKVKRLQHHGLVQISTDDVMQFLP